jgi:putative transcriptional regulator
MLVRQMVRSRLRVLIYERNAILVRNGEPPITVRDLAAKAELSPSVVSGLMTNRIARVDFTTLDKLCSALDCQPGDLLERVADPLPAEPELTAA